YKLLKNLGHGGSASVEKVEDVHTGKVYARKMFRNVYARNLTQAKRRLRDEVEVMKKLAAHHHIVRVHATYIVKRELAIILDPVADGGDLASFLQDFHDSDEAKDGSWSYRRDILRKSFGCLASGLAFMHRQTIRHKDIKPQNILIHRGDVMYTDFGLSYDFGDTGQSTTTGIVQGMTKRYCAPEVADGASRNSKSDIFSLGCVYIEILAKLEP
ncbi:kinase-like domain-containing protein, partial [Paraphoma chrysanthemicola]